MKTSSCRGCGAPIIWAKSEKGANMPIDAEPTSDGGFALLESPDDGHLIAVFHKKLDAYASPLVSGDELRATLPLRTSHHATCPDVDKFRR